MVERMADAAQEGRVERDIRVMTYEVDFAGVVSNQVYHRWLEDLRMDLISRYMDLRELLKAGSVPVLAHTEIDFKRPLKLLDDVKGVMWVEELEGPKWSLRAQFKKGDTVCAEAKQWGVFVESNSFRVIDAPAQLPRVKKA